MKIPLTTVRDRAFRDDLPRRWAALRRLMAEEDLRAVVAAAAGAPSQTGWLRYLTGGDLWQDHAYVVLSHEEEEPRVVVVSPAQQADLAAAAGTGRVEVGGGPGGLVGRLAEILRTVTRGEDRVGVINHNAPLPRHVDRGLRDALPHVDLIDVTAAANCIRQVKSPFELAALSEMGSLLEAGMEMFRQAARPGASAVEVAGEIEGMLRGHGCTWGISKYSFGDRPYLYPARPGRRFAAEDVLVYEFVYASPLGYWYILSSLYAFRPLPPETERLLRATEAAIRETASAAVPGTPCRVLKDTPDRVFADHGLTAVGKHTVDCHLIGTDINDGPGDASDEWTLRENVVVAIHPATLTEGGRGFFLCNLYVVRDGGAVPLTPRGSFYEQLPGG